MTDTFSEAIEQVYDRIGREGSRAPVGLALPVGDELALSLGYPPEVLDALPAEALQGFVGAAPLPALVLENYRGGLVVDCGAGAGVDSFWLASRGVETVALEWSREMLARLKRCVGATGCAPMPVRAKLPEIPLATGRAECVTANGVVNLIGDKVALLDEVWRVLKPGGRFIAADVIALEPLDPALFEDGEAWAFCVAGAKTVGEWGELLEGSGFTGSSVKVVESFPPLGRGLILAQKPGS
jgi:SAM-dependent methyltransferase